MRHGFVWNDVVLIGWTVFLLLRVVPGMLALRKAARREVLAAGWAAVPGTIRGGTVTMADGRWRLTLSYDAIESGREIELWWHNFLTKDQAEHARRALTGRDCMVH